MIKAVFFDFDGTISDARKIAFDSSVKTLEEFGYNVDKKKLREVLGIKTRKMFAVLGVDVENIEEYRERFYEHFTEMAVNGGIRPCVSLKPLWKLKEELPLIVVSNSEKSFLEASIGVLKLDGLFSGVYGVDRELDKDELLLKIFREMGIRPEEAVYVGDRFSDVDFARRVGCVSVAISNKCSWSTRERLEREKPDFIVRDFYGLKKIIKKLNDA